MTPRELEPFALWTGLLGGLAIFLLGMDFLTRGLKGAAGDRMRAWLARLTGNKVRGILTGAVVTAIVNSSSVTTVVLVGFISAGLMGMAQALPVIMGASVGGTVTAQLLAFQITLLALPMISVGVVAWMVAGAERVQQIGAMVLGLGLVFHGMALMSDAMRPLRTFTPFLDLMVAMDNRFVGIAVGAAFTAVIQSSAATTGIVIVLAGQGLVSLEAGIALAFGANIGTCASAGLAAIGKPREAVRAAVAHAVFKILGVAVWVGFLPQLAEWVRLLSPAAPHLTGLDRVAAEAPRQIANAHTLFNVANNIRWLGSGPRCGFFEVVLPDRQPGSSIMPGKVNPVMCESLMQVAARVIGNDTVITTSGAAGGQFQLNIMMPVMGQTTLESIHLMANGVNAFVDFCIDGLEANPQACEASVEQSLSMVTSLNPLIGYEKAASLAKEAFKTVNTIRHLCLEQEVLPLDVLNKALDPMSMTKPS